jgi:hypothetical protein
MKRANLSHPAETVRRDDRSLALAGAALLAALGLLGFLALPAAAHTDVHISFNVGGGPPPPHVVFEGRPGLVRVPRSSVYYVADYAPYDVYRYGPAWYACRDGIWFRASSWRGPWVEEHTIPYDVVYAPAGYAHLHHLPPGQAKKWRDGDQGRGRGWARPHHGHDREY